MSELRRDPLMNRWVIVSVNHDEPLKLLHDPSGPWHTPPESCPFCQGHESFSPGEILAFSEKQRSPGQKGWKVRVIPNRVPCLKVEGNLEKAGIGIYDMTNGVGAHEVVIETPDHELETARMRKADIETVIHAWIERSLDLRRDLRMRSIMVFKNHGLHSGAAQSHAHSQILAMPVIPKHLEEELEGARRYIKWRDRCVFCDMIKQEIADGTRVVAENRHFAAITPYASRFPFETWIVPKKHTDDFASMDKELTASFAAMYGDMIGVLDDTLGNPSFNASVHSAPVNTDEDTSLLYHWHMEIIPRITRDSGFETGSGMFHNPVSPEKAAISLQSALKLSR